MQSSSSFCFMLNNFLLFIQNSQTNLLHIFLFFISWILLMKRAFDTFSLRQLWCDVKLFRNLWLLNESVSLNLILNSNQCMTERKKFYIRNDILFIQQSMLKIVGKFTGFCLIQICILTVVYALLSVCSQRWRGFF